MILESLFQTSSDIGSLMYMDLPSKFLFASTLLSFIISIETLDQFESWVVIYQFMQIECHLQNFAEIAMKEELLCHVLPGYRAKINQLKSNHPTPNKLALIYLHYANVRMLVLLSKSHHNPELLLSHTAVELARCVETCECDPPTQYQFDFLALFIQRVSSELSQCLHANMDPLTVHNCRALLAKARLAFFENPLWECDEGDDEVEGEEEGEDEGRQGEEKKEHESESATPTPTPTPTQSCQVQVEHRAEVEASPRVEETPIEAVAPIQEAPVDKDPSVHQDVAVAPAGDPADCGERTPPSPPIQPVQAPRKPERQPRVKQASRQPDPNGWIVYKRKAKAKGGTAKQDHQDHQDHNHTEPTITLNFPPESIIIKPIQDPVGLVKEAAKDKEAKAKASPKKQRKARANQKKAEKSEKQNPDIEKILHEHKSAVSKLPQEPNRPMQTINVPLEREESACLRDAKTLLRKWMLNQKEILQAPQHPRIPNPLRIGVQPELNSCLDCANAKQTSCPEILRYLYSVVAAIAVLKKNTTQIKQIFWDELFVLLYCSDLNVAQRALIFIVQNYASSEAARNAAAKFINLHVILPLVEFFAPESTRYKRQIVLLALSCTYKCPGKGCRTVSCIFKKIKVYQALLQDMSTQLS